MKASSVEAAQPLHVPTVTDEIARTLRGLILDGDFVPGERLIEEQLADRFGVSRPPIREALRILSQNGLVVGVPRRGFTVVALTADDIRQLYDLRFALERTAIELGVPVGDPSLLAPLQSAVDRMSSKAAQRDPDEMLRANSAFHTALVALPANRWLDDAYARISQQLDLCMAMNLRFRQQMYNDPLDSVRRHQSLVDLIAKGKTAPILSALSAHGDRSFLRDVEGLLEPLSSRVSH